MNTYQEARETAAALTRATRTVFRPRQGRDAHTAAAVAHAQAAMLGEYELHAGAVEAHTVNANFYADMVGETPIWKDGINPLETYPAPQPV